jgi:hypothetical protein
MMKVKMTYWVLLMASVLLISMTRPDKKNEFCTVLIQAYDAALENPAFSSIKGVRTDSNRSTVSWKSKYNVPSADSTIIEKGFASANYTAYLLSTKDKKDAYARYERYKKDLAACLPNYDLKLGGEARDDANGTILLMYQKPSNRDKDYSIPTKTKIKLSLRKNFREVYKLTIVIETSRL